MALRSIDVRDEIKNFQCRWEVVANKASAFLKDSNSETEFELPYPLTIVDDVEDYKSCKVYLFKNRFFSREDHYFNIASNNNRLGVIFPLKIYYESSQLPAYDLSKTTAFLYRFLHIAFYNLIMDDNLPSKTVDIGSLRFDDVKITDFYDDETVVLLYHDGSSSFPDDLVKYYPSLFKYGYVPIHDEKEFKKIEMIQLSYHDQPLYDNNIFDTLQLRECNSSIIKERFIDQIFSSTLKFSLTPLSRFILLYQVIELLIDRIAYQSYQSNFLPISTLAIKLDTVNKATSYRDIYSRLQELRNKLDSSVDKVKSEEKRIALLLNDICNLNAISYPNFVSLSQSVIGPNRACSALHEYVYQLRNRIVHDYHNLSLESFDIDDEMTRLNIEFEKIISDVIISYKENVNTFRRF